MKTKIITTILIFIISILSVSAITINQYLNIDFQNVNLNITNKGLIPVINENNKTIGYSYMIEHDAMYKDMNIIREEISYNIDYNDIKSYMSCRNNGNTKNECKQIIINRMKEYFKIMIEKKRNDMKIDQDNIRSLTEEDALNEISEDLDIGSIN